MRYYTCDEEEIKRTKTVKSGSLRGRFLDKNVEKSSGAMPRQLGRAFNRPAPAGGRRMIRRPTK